MASLSGSSNYAPACTPQTAPPSSRQRLLLRRIQQCHTRLPCVRHLPLPALGITALLILSNLLAWTAAALILRFHPLLTSTTLLSYTLGLRHGLDADHISAIDLMTRRLIATGQRPVTVGTWFSLGHSTIVVVTSVVVAATATAVSGRFERFGAVGGIVGSAVSALFLLVLGAVNAYILYRLVVQMRKVLDLDVAEGQGQEDQAWKVEGGGCMFRILKGMFKLIDRPWKMYPLGVLFGLGFDTSSEIALLGISAIQAAKGTSIWLILLFPLMFTVGMCLVDTVDGAFMLTIYILPMDVGGDGEKEKKKKKEEEDEDTGPVVAQSGENAPTMEEAATRANRRAKDPLTFLYYSIVLTALTVIVALVIGIIQLLTLILNVATPSGRFWDSVASAGAHYEVIGGAICASFVVFGGLSVLLYKPWRRRVERGRRGRCQPRRMTGAEVEQRGRRGSGEPVEIKEQNGGLAAELPDRKVVDGADAPAAVGGMLDYEPRRAGKLPDEVRAAMY